LITEHGEVGIDTPRDRDGGFSPKIVKKRQRRFEGFGEKILALHSRGLSTRDIQARIAEIYGVHVGRGLVSRLTDAVMDDARAWQQRPLDDIYPGRLSRRPGPEDPRRRIGPTPRVLPGSRRQPGWQP
jgi:transposase-like protein